MLELLVLGVLVFAGLCVFNLFWAVASMFCWLIFLPFQILGWVFRGFTVLLALPFIAVIGVLALVVFGVGFLMFLIPAFPLVLLATGVWWLMRRRDRRSARVVV